jgi:hypothetical protein
MPKSAEMPTVLAALRWLLSASPHTDDHAIMRMARVCGLFRKEGRDHWRAGDAELERFAHPAFRRLPKDPAQLGDVLHGLGEISAWSHVDLLTPLVRCLSRRRPRVRWKAVLETAVRCDPGGRPPMSIETIAFTQWIAGAAMRWETFAGAVNYLRHPRRHALFRFGLKLVVKIVLAIDPRAIDDWIDAHATHSSLAVIGDVAIRTQGPWESVSRKASLLRSRKPALKCLAAAALVLPAGPQSTPAGFRQCWRELDAHGIDCGTATWMMGLRIKEAIHARYWAEHVREQSEIRLRVLERQPGAAHGGARNAEAEGRDLRARIGQANAQHAQLVSDLEATLTDLAALWPAQGLSGTQMKELDPIFVDTPEIRYRLAEKLAHKGNRDQLLKANLTQLSTFLSLGEKPDADVEGRFHPDEKRFALIAPWTAQSIVMLYSGDRRGIGRRTADLLHAVGNASERLIEQPFIAARKPVAWQSAAARAAYAHRFALQVVASAPLTQRDGVATLNRFAIEHAFSLLLGPGLGSLDGIELVDALTVAAVDGMDLLPAPDAIRMQWAETDALPNFARAFAIWSSPALVELHPELASRLFRNVSEEQLSRHGVNRQAWRLLNLLDLAVASAASDQRWSVIQEVSRLWLEVCANGSAIASQWGGTAVLLAGAVAEQGDDRAALLSEPAFAQSRCRQFIASRAEQGCSDASMRRFQGHLLKCSPAHGTQR